MQRDNFKVVIVGHVDHGKSTFIGRLLYDTDSIPPDKMETIEQVCIDLGKPLEFAFITDSIREEREKGITIDTTQIFFHTGMRDYVIIDAPGHKEFMKNMITGASQAEGAVLLVDVDEGVREQTRRHAYVLSLLGLKQNIVLLNKMDLVDHKKEVYESVKADIEKLFDGLGIPATYVIPISAANGDNVAIGSELMDWYTGPTAIEALDELEKKEGLEEQDFRMPIQDVYDVNGEKFIVGRVETGRVIEGESVMVFPANKECTVTGVKEFGRERISAEYGECIGLTIDCPEFASRGSMLSSNGSVPTITSQIHASVFWMCPYPASVGRELVFRCNTQEVRGCIKTILRRVDSSSSELIEENAQMLKETEVGEVIIETKQPLILELFDNIPELGRFVLEERGDIVAGGVVTRL